MISARGPQIPDSERIAHLGALMGQASFEITPRDGARLDKAAVSLRAGTAIHITHLPGVPARDVIEAAAHVARLGLTPVPHIAARNFKNKGEAEGFIAELAEKAQVKRAFLIGGDASVAQGPFRSALDLLETGLLEQHGVKAVGFGVYPEGHPAISDSILERSLLAKLESAKARGLDIFLVTQFCLEPEPIVRLMQHLRALHVGAELRIGLAGPSRPDALLRFAMRCGVGPSIRVLTKQGAAILRLLALWEPDRLVQAVAETTVLSHPITSFHFYTMGGLERAIGWTRAVREGRIALKPAGGGFSIVD